MELQLRHWGMQWDLKLRVTRFLKTRLDFWNRFNKFSSCNLKHNIIGYNIAGLHKEQYSVLCYLLYFSTTFWHSLKNWVSSNMQTIRWLTLVTRMASRKILHPLCWGYQWSLSSMENSSIFPLNYGISTLLSHTLLKFRYPQFKTLEFPNSEV